jgi:hypothetical protein
MLMTTRLMRPRLWRVPAPAESSERPLCIVYGNCQAEPIRTLLDRSPSFSARFRTEPVPAVHTITSATIAGVRDAVARASLIVSHPVRDGYHGFPVGSEEILGSARRRCRRVMMPALYYDGLYPFHVYLRANDARSSAAPLSVYHDLRFLFCAARGWDLARSLAWWREFVPPAGGVRQIAAEAHERLFSYEASSRLDVRVGPEILETDLHGRSFLTVDHPTNLALDQVVAGIHGRLGLSYKSPALDDELLGDIRAPLEAAVIDALDLGVNERRDWEITGTAIAQEDLLARHLAWYADRPELVAGGTAQLERRMYFLGLAE